MSDQERSKCAEKSGCEGNCTYFETEGQDLAARPGAERCTEGEYGHVDRKGKGWRICRKCEDPDLEPGYQGERRDREQNEEKCCSYGGGSSEPVQDAHCCQRPREPDNGGIYGAVGAPATDEVADDRADTVCKEYSRDPCGGMPPMWVSSGTM